MIVLSSASKGNGWTMGIPMPGRPPTPVLCGKEKRLETAAARRVHRAYSPVGSVRSPFGFPREGPGVKGPRQLRGPPNRPLARPLAARKATCHQAPGRQPGVRPAANPAWWLHRGVTLSGVLATPGAYAPGITSPVMFTIPEPVGSAGYTGGLRPRLRADVAGVPGTPGADAPGSGAPLRLTRGRASRIVIAAFGSLLPVHAHAGPGSEYRDP